MLWKMVTLQYNNPVQGKGSVKKNDTFMFIECKKKSKIFFRWICERTALINLMQNNRQGTVAMQPKMETVYAYRFVAGYKCPINIYALTLVIFGPYDNPLTGLIIVLLYFQYNNGIFF